MAEERSPESASFFLRVPAPSNSEVEEQLAEITEQTIERYDGRSLGERTRRDAQGDDLRVDFTYDAATPPVAVEIWRPPEPNVAALNSELLRLEERLRPIVRDDELGTWRLSVRVGTRRKDVEDLLVEMMRGVRPHDGDLHLIADGLPTDLNDDVRRSELCSASHTGREQRNESRGQNAPGESSTPGEGDAIIGGTRSTESGEAGSPKGSFEDSVTTRTGPVEDVETEVDRRLERAIASGRAIEDEARYRGGIRRNVLRDSAADRGGVPAPSSPEIQRWADGIDGCYLCASNGWIQVRDRSNGRVETSRCTHHKETYEGAEILTANVA
jgi:hypothetical protein